MNFKRLFCSVAIFLCIDFTQAQAQPRTYSVSNAHAHNDYEHPLPFYTAYSAGFGSIEADVILYYGRLCVAHDTAGIKPQRTLQSLYLDPLQKAINKNRGYAYADSTKQLLLLIDLKTPVEPTLAALLQVLKQYKTITGCPGLKLVITGNRPPVSELASYPSYVSFDGDISKSYSPEALDKVVLFSEDFRGYSKWKGEGRLPDSAQAKLATVIKEAHRLNKPIRFWAAPDGPAAWNQLINLDADYINTDKIFGLAEFLKKRAAHSLQRKQ